MSNAKENDVITPKLRKENIQSFYIQRKIERKNEIELIEIESSDEDQLPEKMSEKMSEKMPSKGSPNALDREKYQIIELFTDSE